MDFRPLDRDGIAGRIARDIPEGWFVNLGIGIPTKVSDFVPPDREVSWNWPWPRLRYKMLRLTPATKISGSPSLSKSPVATAIE